MAGQRLRAILGRRLRDYAPDGAKQGAFSGILSLAGFFSSSPPRLRVTAKKAQSAMA
jgi:anti-sigma factor ChrR (cupin superfamily)